MALTPERASQRRLSLAVSHKANTARAERIVHCKRHALLGFTCVFDARMPDRSHSRASVYCETCNHARLRFAYRTCARLFEAPRSCVCVYRRRGQTQSLKRRSRAGWRLPRCSLPSLRSTKTMHDCDVPIVQHICCAHLLGADYGRAAA